MSKLRLSFTTSVSQGHTANVCKIGDLNPVLLLPESFQIHVEK